MDIDMGAVNTSRRKLAQNVNHATEHGRLIGFNDDGETCVWSGGYTFNVYNVVDEWQEIRQFTSGTMTDDKNKEKARKMMEEREFEIIE